jgi:hypothetical protein
MKKFLKTYRIVLAKERVLYSIYSINHYKAEIRNKVKRIQWVQGHLETITLLEIKVGLLFQQLTILEQLANNIIYFWDQSEHRSDFQRILSEQLASPLFHNLQLSEKDLLFLSNLDSIAQDWGDLEKYDPFISQLIYIDKEQIDLAELEIKEFIVRSFSFDALLNMVRNTNPYIRKSVQDFLNILSAD